MLRSAVVNHTEPRHTVKLSDVARHAKVSTATASRALTLPHKVNAGTLERVQQAVKVLGYVADGAGRALASRRTHTVGAVIPTLDNAIFANTTHALQRTLDEAGYTLLLACHEFDTCTETRVTRALIERGVDALVLVGAYHEPELFSLMETRAIPYVLTWALDPTGRHPCVGFDNRAAAIRLTHYLLDLGHREFAMIAGVAHKNERAGERIEGVGEALAAHGLELSAGRVVEKPYSFAAGREGLREVIAASGRPTAVICGNDVLAMGALAECAALGIAVPGEVSVAGFDDLEVASLITPALTTVRFPTTELGACAAKHLLARLSGEGVAPPRELPVELMVRGSTAAPADTGPNDSTR